MSPRESEVFYICKSLIGGSPECLHNSMSRLRSGIGTQDSVRLKPDPTETRIGSGQDRAAYEPPQTALLL
jgi:hypothetical protein